MTTSPVDNIPGKSSPPESWVEWYKELKSSYGSAVARQLWVKAWSKRGGVDSNANTVALRDAMNKEGIVIDKSAIASVIDIASNIGSGIGDTISGILSIGKWTAIAVIVIALGGAGMIIYNIARNPNATIKAAGR